MYVQVTITVFNKRLSADRREVYFPTCISGASYYESKSSGHSTDGAHAESLTYKLRLPIDAKVQNDRIHANERAFKAMTEVDVITVKEYADNTIRGSAAVKHWRIGGE